MKKKSSVLAIAIFLVTITSWCFAETNKAIPTIPEGVFKLFDLNGGTMLTENLTVTAVKIPV